MSNIGNQGTKLSKKVFRMEIFERVNYRVSFTDFRNVSEVTVALIIFEHDQVEKLSPSISRRHVDVPRYGAKNVRMTASYPFVRALLTRNGQKFK